MGGFCASLTVEQASPALGGQRTPVALEEFFGLQLERVGDEAPPRRREPRAVQLHSGAKEGESSAACQGRPGLLAYVCVYITKVYKTKLIPLRASRESFGGAPGTVPLKT